MTTERKQQWGSGVWRGGGGPGGGGGGREGGMEGGRDEGRKKGKRDGWKDEGGEGVRLADREGERRDGVGVR